MPPVRTTLLALALACLPTLASADTIRHLSRDPDPAPLGLENSDGSLLISRRQDVLLLGLSGQTRAVLLSGNRAIGTVAYTGSSIVESAPRFAPNNELSSVDVALFAINSSMPPSEQLRRTPRRSHLDAPDDRQFDDPSATPEPPTLALLLPGAAAMLLLLRRRRAPGTHPLS